MALIVNLPPFPYLGGGVPIFVHIVSGIIFSVILRGLVVYETGCMNYSPQTCYNGRHLLDHEILK
jgi:hypothetical protein